MILVQQAYRSNDAVRQAELDRASALNESLGIFQTISRVDGSKGRLTYDDLFSHAARYFAGKVCVVANSDISFDESLEQVASLVHENVLISLTRWESAAGPIMGGHIENEEHGKLFSHSQDTWIFLAGTLPRFRTDFRLGVLACETRLAYEAAAAGMLVFNPALSVRTHHHHQSNVRTYKLTDVYDGPRYLARVTTADAPIAEGYVIDRKKRPKGRIVRLDGCPESFAQQMCKRVSIACESRVLRRVRVSFRSPIHIRWR